MALNPKYKFRDLSIIRWVNDLSHFNDRFNTQNNQYFGNNNYTHKLSIKNDDLSCFYDGIHRLVITNYDIDLITPVPNDLKVWFVNEYEEFELNSFVESNNNLIYYVTFLIDEVKSIGRLELRSGGVTYKYSECIKFIDEKLIVIHTRNYFDRKGIKWSYEPQYNWIRTTLPSNDLGITNINPEREIQYLGSRNTPVSVESRDEETIKYEFLVGGKSIVLDSIESLSGNIQGSDIQGGFYLDLIKLTPDGDMDREDDNINGTITYLLHKNDDGSNVFVDDSLIFEDLQPLVILLQPLDESFFTVGVDNTFQINVTYSIPVQLTDDLNKEIRIYKDSTIIETLTINDVSISLNILNIKSSQTYTEGVYNIQIDDDFVFETTFGSFGAEGIDDWNFTVEEFRYFEDQFEDQFE